MYHKWFKRKKNVTLYLNFKVVVIIFFFTIAKGQ